MGIGGVENPALAVADVEEEDEEDTLRGAREGAGRVVAAKGHKGPGAEGAVVRAQI